MGGLSLLIFYLLIIQISHPTQIFKTAADEDPALGVGQAGADE